MSWLVAAVAFAVAMMLFSTITSTVTECLHRLFHMRERGLRMMLERLFEDTVWPHLADRADGVAKDVACTRFVEQLTRNRAVPTTGRFRMLGEWLAPARITSLSPLELAGRLAETDFGTRLAARRGAAVEVAIDDLARRFERIGADASAYFQQRATTLSLLVAIGLAFVLNVDALRLFRVLASDHALAARLAAQGDAASAGGRRPTPVPAPADAGDATAGVAAIDADLEHARRQAAELLASGLPIGSRYFPYCDDGGLGDACAALVAERTRRAGAYAASPLFATLGTIRDLPRVWLRWFAFTVLSGLLIGLGSPFWFSAFTRLSSLVELGRVLGLRTRHDAEAGNAREAPVPAAPAPPPTPAAAFRAALPPPTGRLVLAPGGSPLTR